MRRRVVVVSLVACVFFPATWVRAQTWLGPTPYLSDADSPFAAEIAAGDVLLEDFEDGTLDLPGVVSNGMLAEPGPVADSVDADDGAIDGFGNGGHSWFLSPGSLGLSFTFDPLAPGGLPVEAGLVWTDGAGTVSFEAFDENGASLGVQGPFDFPDAAVTGETAEDRFLGLSYAGGISAIVASNTEGGIEVDHVQRTAPPSATCEDAPAEGCRAAAGPGAAKLTFVDRREALKWKWSGAGITLEDYGDPLARTGYTLCVHDAVEGVFSLVLEARIPAGDGWKARKRSFAYKRKDGDPDGVVKLSLKAPAPGSTRPAKIKLAGRDVELAGPPLSQSPEVVVQLHHDDGECFEARYGAPAKKNDEKKFVDLGD